MFWMGLIVGLGVWVGVDNLAVFFVCRCKQHKWV